MHDDDEEFKEQTSLNLGDTPRRTSSNRVSDEKTSFTIKPNKFIEDLLKQKGVDIRNSTGGGQNSPSKFRKIAELKGQSSLPEEMENISVQSRRSDPGPFYKSRTYGADQLDRLEESMETVRNRDEISNIAYLDILVVLCSISTLIKLMYITIHTLITYLSFSIQCSYFQTTMQNQSLSKADTEKKQGTKGIKLRFKIKKNDSKDPRNQLMEILGRASKNSINSENFSTDDQIPEEKEASTSPTQKAGRSRMVEVNGNANENFDH